VEKPALVRLVEHLAAFYISPLCASLLGKLESICRHAYVMDNIANLKEIAMSAHLVAGLDFPSELPTATAPYFLLGLNSRGVWVIRETTGRRAGLFRTREAAIKYAREESLNGNFTILHQPEGLELDSSQISEAA
jgi:hypothetical protein